MERSSALVDTDKKIFRKKVSPNVFESYPAIFEILGSILRRGCGKLICFCNFAQIVSH